MKLEWYSYTCFLLAFLICLEQYIVWNDWFTISQIHHETFAVGLVCLGVGLLAGRKHRRKR